MAKPIGSRKTGGRKKGTPNRRTSTLVDLLEESGIDPVKTIVEEMSKLSGGHRIGVCMDLLPYLYPKRRSAEEPFSIDRYLDGLSPAELASLARDIERRQNPPQRLASKDEKKEFSRRVAEAVAQLEVEC